MASAWALVQRVRGLRWQVQEKAIADMAAVEVATADIADANAVAADIWAAHEGFTMGGGDT